jgi:hypothetical protein
MKHCANVECSHLTQYGEMAEFVDSADRCSDCGGELEAGEVAPAPAPEYQELVTVYEANTGVQAHLVKAALEAEEIPVHVSGEALLGAIGELPPTMLQVRVQVPAEHTQRAREIALACDESEDETGA